MLNDDDDDDGGGCGWWGRVIFGVIAVGARAFFSSAPTHLAVVDDAPHVLPVGGDAHVGQYVGHVGRARELEVRALPDGAVVHVGRQAVDVHLEVGRHLDEIVQALKVGQRWILADAAQRWIITDAAQRGRLRVTVHRFLFDGEIRGLGNGGQRGRRRRRVRGFSLDQQVIVLHQVPGEQIGRRLIVQVVVLLVVELLVHLSGGHERCGRTGTEQHGVGVGAVLVAVIVVYVGQHRDRGRCVERRVEQLDFERLDDVEAARQRRVVVERGALRRVWRVTRRAGRHLGVYRGGHTHFGRILGTVALSRINREMILEPIRVHRAHPVHLYDAVAPDERL